MTVAELSRSESTAQSLYYRWTKEFLEAGKQRQSGNTKPQEDSSEIQVLLQQNDQLKQLAAVLSLKNRVLKKV